MISVYRERINLQCWDSQLCFLQLFFCNTLMILDGKKLAGEIYNELSKKIQKLEKKPTLWAVLVWDNSASLRYIWQKKKFSEKVGINFNVFKFPTSISEEELLYEIKKLNQDSDVSWYIVQLPLPKHIDALRVIRNIDPKKDVDGFHPENQWKIIIGDETGFAPCTPAWVMRIFSNYNIQLSWKKIVILGQSNIVWKPMAMMCINAGASVTSCNNLTPDISLYTLEADIIITATGVVGLITPEIVKKDAIIIDVGFSIHDGQISWDACYKELLTQWNTITPVPGWVGPMTVAMLLTNTYNAYMRNI